MTLATESSPLRPAPYPEPSRLRRIAAPGAVIGGLAAATLAVHLRDPHVTGSWGICPSAALGFWCPGCGGLRAVHDLTHLEVGSAFALNPVVVLGVPLVSLMLLVWFVSRWRDVPNRLPRLWERAALPVLGLLLLFMVLRNLPWFSVLAP